MLRNPFLEWTYEGCIKLGKCLLQELWPLVKLECSSYRCVETVQYL